MAGVSLSTLSRWLFICGLTLLAGCRPEDAIRRYHAPKSADSTPGLRFDTPAGWQPSRLSMMRKAAFEVSDGPQRVEITVAVLPIQGGDIVPNVNRWREQLGLDELSPPEIESQLGEIMVGELRGAYVKLVGNSPSGPLATWGVIVHRDDMAWFFKMMGDADLVQREEPRFEQFVRSVEFTQ
jgi:hypothetical protein